MKYNLRNLEKNVFTIFKKIGCNENDAKTVTEILLSAELRGIPSHGIIRIKDYLLLWAGNRIKTQPNIRIVHSTPTTAVVDGDSGFGMVVAKKAMEIAIEKSQQNFTGMVAVKNSNHYGIAGYYSMMALKHDMIGISMTNGNPLVIPTNSIDRFLGTNPIAVAIPANKEPPFVADFATTPIARGKLELAEKKGEKVEFGLVQDKHGNPSQDPSILKHGGGILPLGGDITHGGHKGFCLSSIVDIFSSVLSGASFGPFVPPQVAYLPLNQNAPGNGLGHFFTAMRIDAFQSANDFKNYMDLWIQTFKKAKPIEGIDMITIPGEPEREFEKKLSKEGITVNDKVLEELENTLEKLSIKSPF